MRFLYQAFRRWAQVILRWVEGRREPRHEEWLLSATWIEDVPDTLRPDRIYFVGAGRPAFAVMVCPCGCGSDIHLNLLREVRPHWAWEIGPLDEVTLHPSVWKTQGCRSHFFVYKGRIKWASSSSEYSADR